MRIIGIDPGTGILGWGLIIQDGGKVIPVKYGCVRTPAKMDQPSRLLHIYNSLCDIISSNNSSSKVRLSQYYFNINKL